ncbi:hypothetical protein PO250_10370 [Limosilactobacillus mucosae]|uniref:Membrane protein 6-pyruvoyl-tetrahydropterin synthase-related domain-containing protein n=1 Tax=Limosilactobacillus mucosae TaxID=97478 RepID=A0AAJ1HWG8_LIMMU|nr:hypothetical protein [Limosilactobacillus mucosae]MDC2830676.1 hypothetical protein [Limosilactobacillus mucosae]
MVNRFIKNRQRVITFEVAILFILFWIWWFYKQIKIGTFNFSDTFFHASRVYEIRYAFLHHELPNWLNYQSYFGLGQAVNAMYPDISLWPFVLLTLPLSFKDQLVALRIIILFLTWLVTYISLRHHEVSIDVALFASIIYTLSGYSLYLAVNEFQVGTGIIYIFSFPLFFTLQELFETPRMRWWLILKLALLFSIVLYSHLLSAIVLAIIITFIVLYRWLIEFKSNRYVILNLICSGLLTIIYTLPIFIRYFWITKSKVSPPYHQGIVDGLNFVDLFYQSSWSATARYAVPLVAIVLLSITLVHSKNPAIFKLIGIETFLIFISSDIFPWVIFDKIPLINNLQVAAWRFAIWLSIIPIIVYLKEFKPKCFKQTSYRFLCVLAIIAIFASIQSIKTTDIKFMQNVDGSNVRLNEKLMKKFQGRNLTKNNELHRLWLIRDYAPLEASPKGSGINTTKTTQSLAFKPSISNENHKVVRVKKQPINNGIKMKIMDNLDGRYVRLPLYGYRTVDYSVKLNNKIIKYQDSNGYIQIKPGQELKAGDMVTVKTQNPRIYAPIALLSVILFVISCIPFLGGAIYKKCSSKCLMIS